MNWKQTVFAGACTGALVSLLMIGNIFLGIAFKSPYTGTFSFLLILSIPPLLIQKAFQFKNIKAPLKHLLPLSALTFFIPVLGVAFGLPNANIKTLCTFVLLSSIGGILWSLPFALWSVLRQRRP